MRDRLVLALAPFLLPAGMLYAQAGGCVRDSYAIQNARVITVTHGVLNRANIVLCDGVITAVGASAAIPAGAEVVDGSGLTVYPGLIDAYSNYAEPQRRGPGAAAAGAAGGAGGAPGATPPKPLDPAPPNAASLFLQPEPVGVTPEAEVADTLDPHDDLLAVRDRGVTTAVVIPNGGGVLQGEAALVNLRGPDAESMVIRRDLALVAELNRVRRGGLRYPTSKMGAVAIFRQALMDAQRYASNRALYDSAAERNGPHPEVRRSLLALQPALERQQPVVFIALKQNDINRALALAHEFNLRPVIAGATEGWKTVNAIKAANAGVLVSLQFEPENKDELGPDELKKEVTESQSNPAALARAGIHFALTGQGLRPRDDLFTTVKAAMDHGLSATDALNALTIWPAQILGVDHLLGSIETGKLGDLVVATGDPLVKTTEVRLLFIDGQPYGAHPAESRPQPRAGQEDAAQPAAERTPPARRGPRPRRQNPPQ